MGQDWPLLSASTVNTCYSGKIRNLADKNVILSYHGFYLYLWLGFLLGFFLLSLNLYILSPDVVLAAYCTSFSFWAGYFPEESWRCLKLKKQPNFLFQMLWQYKNGINFTVAFSCRNIWECVHLFLRRKKKKTYLHHMHFIKAKVFLFFRFNVSN